MNRDYQVLHSIKDFVNDKCLCDSCIYNYSHSRVARIIQDLYAIVKDSDAVEELNEKETS